MASKWNKGDYAKQPKLEDLSIDQNALNKKFQEALMAEGEGAINGKAAIWAAFYKDGPLFNDPLKNTMLPKVIVQITDGKATILTEEEAVSKSIDGMLAGQSNPHNGIWGVTLRELQRRYPQTYENYKTSYGDMSDATLALNKALGYSGSIVPKDRLGDTESSFQKLANSLAEKGQLATYTADIQPTSEKDIREILRLALFDKLKVISYYDAIEKGGYNGSSSGSFGVLYSVENAADTVYLIIGKMKVVTTIGKHSINFSTVSIQVREAGNTGTGYTENSTYRSDAGHRQAAAMSSAEAMIQRVTNMPIPKGASQQQIDLWNSTLYSSYSAGSGRSAIDIMKDWIAKGRANDKLFFKPTVITAPNLYQEIKDNLVQKAQNVGVGRILVVGYMNGGYQINEIPTGFDVDVEVFDMAEMAITNQTKAKFTSDMYTYIKQVMEGLIIQYAVIFYGKTASTSIISKAFLIEVSKILVPLVGKVEAKKILKTIKQSTDNKFVIADWKIPKPAMIDVQKIVDQATKKANRSAQQLIKKLRKEFEQAEKARLRAFSRGKRGLQPERQVDSTSIIDTMNRNLRAAVIQEMGPHSLMNRTSRFASSVKITRASEKSLNFIYERNPYGVFRTQGGDERVNHPRTRDPGVIIRKAIRNIAHNNLQEFFKDRLYIRED